MSINAKHLLVKSCDTAARMTSSRQVTEIISIYKIIRWITRIIYPTEGGRESPTNQQVNDDICSVIEGPV